MENLELTARLGFEPSGPQKKIILELMRNTGSTLAAAIDVYSLPSIVIPDEGGVFECDGDHFTLETFQEKWPGRRIVIIK